DARRANESADVYSVGAILYNAVVGAPAFDISTFRVKLSEEAPAVVTGRSDPTALAFAGLVQRAMRRRPAERFASAQEMLVALEAIPLPPASPR
ncbi:MAG TPA: hypothetical protein PK141_23505, partial [Polyangiaceae bacterium]|nr:hypothetical protein [Polyangiaceae bacterium]